MRGPFLLAAFLAACAPTNSTRAGPQAAPSASTKSQASTATSQKVLVVDDEQVELTGTVRAGPSITDPHWGPLEGADFLLMIRAYQHPAINGRDMSCYEVAIIRDSKRTVAFIGDREAGDVERAGPGGPIITERGPNPRCPTVLFEMDDAGKVVRVVKEGER